jgi:AraC-like DNA-binding protein
MTAAPEFTRFRFSTDLVPPNERFAVWREIFGRAVVKLDMQAVDDTPLRVEASMRRLPDVGYASVESTPYRCERTGEFARESGAEFGFVVVTQGAALASQRGREIELSEGEAVLLRHDEEGVVHFPSTARHTSFSIPERVLALLVSNPSDLCTQAIPADSPTLRLLLRYVELLETNDELITLQAQHAISEHIHDLLALTIGASREAAEIAGGRGVSAARLRAVKDDILANLGHRGLSIDTLAKQHGISPRYIRKLFDGDGMTFSEFVLHRRLERAHKVLTDPRFDHLTISAIAFETGFGDLSYFNRVFRRQYGVTPSDVRNAARAPGEFR